MQFDRVQDIEEEINSANLNGHSKKYSASLKSLNQNEHDQNEGGEFLNYDGYQGDGGYLSTSHCNIQANDSDDSDDTGDLSFRSAVGLVVASKPSEDKSSVKVESFTKLSQNEMIAVRIRKELETRN